MTKEEIVVTSGDGRYRIDITAFLTADGLSVFLTGGERPHVGGTVLSVPRPDGSPEQMSCDTWVCPVPGHRDCDAARPVAEFLCKETGLTVAVVAGIHIDLAEKPEILMLVDNCMKAAGMLVERLTKKRLGE